MTSRVLDKVVIVTVSGFKTSKHCVHLLTLLIVFEQRKKAQCHRKERQNAYMRMANILKSRWCPGLDLVLCPKPIGLIAVVVHTAYLYCTSFRRLVGVQLCFARLALGRRTS